MLGCVQRGLLKELQQEYALLSSDDAAHFSALPIAKVMNKCKPRDTTCWQLGCIRRQTVPIVTVQGRRTSSCTGRSWRGMRRRWRR